MKSSLVGYNPQGLKELDATEAAEHRGTHTCSYTDSASPIHPAKDGRNILGEMACPGASVRGQTGKGHAWQSSNRRNFT